MLSENNEEIANLLNCNNSAIFVLLENSEEIAESSRLQFVKLPLIFISCIIETTSITIVVYSYVGKMYACSISILLIFQLLIPAYVYQLSLKIDLSFLSLISIILTSFKHRCTTYD